MALCVIAGVSYFAAVQNGVAYATGDISDVQFKAIVITIISFAFIAVGFIFYRSYIIYQKLDISQRTLAMEKKLFKMRNQQLEEFEKTLNSVNQSIVIIGKNDKIEWANEGFLNMFGYSLHETLGMRSSDLLAGELTDRKIIEQIDEAVFKRLKPYSAEIIHYRKDQSTLWANLHITPILTEAGELEKYIAISEDITEVVEARKKLVKSEANFRQIADTVNDCFYLYNIEENKYEFISENSKDIIGIPSEMFYEGTHGSQIELHPSDVELYKSATKKVNSGEAYTIEYRIKINDDWRWIEESSFPIINSDGKVVRNSGICTDISDRKLINQQLKSKNAEILESIRYAKEIQQATLTQKKDIQTLFTDFTLFYSPKDIVSGDFYNVSTIRTNSHKELKSIVVADCTGHGVPGAVLAITCSNIIQSTFSNPAINSPAEALDHTRTELESLLGKGEETLHDGMDVSWLVWNEGEMELYFAGAFNNCYILRQEEVITLKGDKMHVGFTEKPQKFSHQVFKAEKGDLVFMTTDGYTDQFGGENAKKFGRKRFFELLKTYSTASLDEQNLLEKSFYDWKQNHEQTDDVCVFGFRV